MSLYYDYLQERKIIDIIEEDWGFVTFNKMYSNALKANVLYIRDIYVIPEERRNGKAIDLLNWCADRALKEGLIYIMGSTDLEGPDIEQSFAGHLHYKFKVLELEGTTLYWYKELM